MTDKDRLIEEGIFRGWTEEQVIAYMRGYFYGVTNCLYALGHGLDLQQLSDYVHNILAPWFFRGKVDPPPDIPLSEECLSYCGGYWMEFPNKDDEVEMEISFIPEGEINRLLSEAEEEER